MRFGNDEEIDERDARRDYDDLYDRDQDDFISEEEWEDLVADEEDLIEQIRYNELDFDPDRLELIRRDLEMQQEDNSLIERYYRDPPEEVGPENEDHQEDVESTAVAARSTKDAD